MDVKYLIKDYLRRRNFREWVNARFKEDRAVVLDRTDINYIVTNHDNKFLMSPDIHSATSVYWRYKWYDIRRTDKVIDLGANVGGFTLLAYRLSDQPILALEPVRFSILTRNLMINDGALARVTPVCAGIGTSDITWREGHATVPVKTLTELRIINGGCDFLKMDIEGAEWSIDPKELEGIRRIEGQFHYPHKGFSHPLIDYIEENYYVEYAPNIPPKNRPVLPQYTPYELNPVFHAVKK